MRRLKPIFGLFPPLEHLHLRRVTAKHGRIDYRILYTTPTFKSDLDWPGVQQVACLDRLRLDKRTGEALSARRNFYLISLDPNTFSRQHVLDLCQGHWTIENQSHRVRDVTFHEDASQVRKGGLPQVLAALRNTALTLLRRFHVTHIPSAFITNAARPVYILAYLFQ